MEILFKKIVKDYEKGIFLKTFIIFMLKNVIIIFRTSYETATLNALVTFAP